MNHGGQLDPVNSSGNVVERGIIAFAVWRALRSGRRISFFTPALPLESFPAFPGHESGDGKQHDDKTNADSEIHIRLSLQILNELRACFDPADGANHHQPAQPEIDIAESAMLLGGDN